MSNTHDATRFAGLDLDALVALDTLIETGSVTRSAQLRGVTQSAMSHTLRKLRSQLGDPLLIREGARMRPTPRAEALRAPLRSALLALDLAVHAGRGFEAGTSAQTFRMASPDLFDAIYLPGLLARLRSEAPGMRLSLLPVPFHLVERGLRQGELDLAVTPFVPDGAGGSTELRRRTLFADGSLVFARAEHPALHGDCIDLDAYLGAAHAMVSPTGRGGGYVDAALQAQGLERRIVLRLPSFLTALAVLAHTDLLLTAPAGLARLTGPELRHLPPPLAVHEHRLGLCWPDRLHEAPGHRWLRGLIVEAVNASRPSGP